jgi:AmiR/NasT family two-component response regulator
MIEQAKGVLAGVTGATVASAFASMRTYARVTGRRLSDVASGVIDGSIDPHAIHAH